MRASTEKFTSEIAIVLVGNFNPIVFQPAWFSNQKLLRAAEVDNASINVIHPDVVSFSTEWLSLQVTRERFTALITSDAYAVHLRDFVVGTFSLLEHTPIDHLGVNCTRSISFENLLDWHDFGHYFAPKSPWLPLHKPGMLQVGIRSERTDGREGNFNWTVEYAGKQKAFLKINDHYDLPNNDSEKKQVNKLGSAEYFNSLLANDFDAMLKNANDTGDLIFQRFSKTDKFDAGTN